MSTIEVTLENLEDTIRKSGIVLLDFWAEWCGPCKRFSPVFEAAAKKHTDVVFGKVDTDKESAIAEAFSIRSIPTLIAFRDGRGVFAQPGMLSAAGLDELIEKLRTLDTGSVGRKVG